MTGTRDDTWQGLWRLCYVSYRARSGCWRAMWMMILCIALVIALPDVARDAYDCPVSHVLAAVP